MKIFCIGKNYSAHAKEMNSKVPKNPLVFMKPPTALNYNKEVPYPSFTSNLHYELEITLLIAKNGKDIALKDAGDYYNDIGLGIDYTARDLQAGCKERGHSWEVSKAFDNSASLSMFYPKSKFDLDKVQFELKLNGNSVQNETSEMMIFKFDYLIHYISKFFTLEAGDVIMTGTPAGVGPLKPGDALKGYLEGDLVLENFIITK